jgi:ribosomal protein S4
MFRFRPRFSIFKRTNKIFFNSIFLNTKNSIRYGYRFIRQRLYRRSRVDPEILKITARFPRLPRKRKTFFGKALDIKQQFSYLLGGFTATTLANIMRKNRKSSFIGRNDKIVRDFETRLEIYMYKTNFLEPGLSARSAIRKGYIRVNDEVIKEPSYNVRRCDIIEFRPPSNIRAKFIRRIAYLHKKGLIFKLHNSYSVISYKLITSIIYKLPNFKTKIFYPFKFRFINFLVLYSR